MAARARTQMGFWQSAVIAVITMYRWTLAALLGGHCRFTPSCSVYGEQAVRRHGAVRGGGLLLRRLSRCHPWGADGFDPVPGDEASHG